MAGIRSAFAQFIAAFHQFQIERLYIPTVYLEIATEEHTLNDERWGDCPGYQGLYEVSDEGRVFNSRRHKFLSGTVTRGGYRQVKLTVGKRHRFHYVHALVLQTFVGPRPEGHVCDHISANRLDNSLSNLEWVTPRENVRRAGLAGRSPNRPRGEKHYRAKFTKGQVQTIRTRYQNGTRLAVLAKENRVAPSTIRQMVKRETWGHVA